MILTTLQKPDAECQIRLIISSVALGMGADLKNVKRIIHAGPPTSLESKFNVHLIKKTYNFPHVFPINCICRNMFKLV